MDQQVLQAEIERQKEGFKIANRVRKRELKARTHEKWLHGLNGLFMVREAGTSLFDDAAFIQKAFTDEGLSFCFIGGIAFQHWGEARQTSDLDLNIHYELGKEAEVLAALLRHLPFRDEESRLTWDSHRVFFGRSPSGYDVDVFVGFTPFERRLTERARSHDYGLDVPLRICAAEYLVVTKTVAWRPRDWGDLITVIQRSGESMDWTLVFEELKPLLELYNETDRLPKLTEMIRNEYPDLTNDN